MEDYAMNPNDLTAENERLRQQVAALTVERDAINRAFLGQLAKTDPGFTEEDMASAIPSGPWLEEFLNRMVEGDPNAMDSIPTPAKG